MYAKRRGPDPGARAAAYLGAAVGLAVLTTTVGIEEGGFWVGPEILTGILLVLVSVPFMRAVHQRRFDLFEPTVVLSGIWLFAYILPAVSIAKGLDPLWNEWGRRAQGDLRPLLSTALSLSAGFLGATLLGYYALPTCPGKATSVVPPALDGSRMRRWAAAMSTIALGLFALMIRQVGGLSVLLSNLNDRVRLFSGLNYLGMPILVLFSIGLLSYAEALRAKRGLRPWLAAFIIFAFAVNTLNGTKTNLFSVLIALLVVRHYIRRPIQLSTAVGTLGVAAVAAVAYDLFFREYLVTGVVRSLYLGGSALDALRDAWIPFSSNTFIHVPVLMLMVDGMPSTLPFQLGAPYGALLTMPIPRVLYPQKPPVGTEIFSRAFFGDLLDQGTSIPTTFVGEFYMNFGAPGVLLGGLLTGAALHLLYRHLLGRRQEATVVPIYALVVGTLFPWSRGDTFGPTVFFLAVAIPIWALARVSRPVTRAATSVGMVGPPTIRDPE